MHVMSIPSVRMCTYVCAWEDVYVFVTECAVQLSCGCEY